MKWVKESLQSDWQHVLFMKWLHRGTAAAVISDRKGVQMAISLTLKQ